MRKLYRFVVLQPPHRSVGGLESVQMEATRCRKVRVTGARRHRLILLYYGLSSKQIITA